jgi:hypothetical protein
VYFILRGTNMTKDVVKVTAAIAVAAAASLQGMAQTEATISDSPVKHVLLLSIDGMHAIDFLNCSQGVAGVNGKQPYCPNLAALGQTGVNYVAATTSKPSDSFPGLMTLMTGATPKTMGIYYDVAYDRLLDAPAKTTGNGLGAGPCTPFANATGTTTEYEEGIDYDQTKLNGGAPGAALTDGGIASIDPKRLIRNPAANCAPVYPWNFTRVNTIFNVIHKAGGYTAWADKHPSYSAVGGPGGVSLNDYYSPEVNSTVIPLSGVKTSEGASCAVIRDTTASASSWTNSFQNIQCNDQLKVNGILNELSGKNHQGTASAPVPAILGMDYQAVSVGQKLIEPGVGSGGYTNAEGTPTPELLKEIEYVDATIGDMINTLKDTGNFDNTVIIVTAKHGQSPIEPGLYRANGTSTPVTLLESMVPASESPATAGGIGPTEDDISLVWLKKGADLASAVSTLETNAAEIGLGQLFYGATVALNYNVPGTEPGQDSRTPDIIVTPNVGVTYSNSKAKLAEHGGFGHDDTNVVLLVSNPALAAKTVSTPVATAQVAPTILTVLGLDRNLLQAVQVEGTAILPGLPIQ